MTIVANICILLLFVVPCVISQQPCPSFENVTTEIAGYVECAPEFHLLYFFTPDNSTNFISCMQASIYLLSNLKPYIPDLTMDIYKIGPQCGYYCLIGINSMSTNVLASYFDFMGIIDDSTDCGNVIQAEAAKVAVGYIANVVGPYAIKIIGTGLTISLACIADYYFGWGGICTPIPSPAPSPVMVLPPSPAPMFYPKAAPLPAPVPSPVPMFYYPSQAPVPSPAPKVYNPSPAPAPSPVRVFHYPSPAPVPSPAPMFYNPSPAPVSPDIVPPPAPSHSSTPYTPLDRFFVTLQLLMIYHKINNLL